MENLKFRDAMIIYANVWESIETLSTIKKKYTAIKSLIEYGIYDILPEVNSPEIKAIINMALPLINESNLNYFKQVNNGEFGKLGGRPEEFTESDIKNLQKRGLTIKQIANTLGCNPSTVYRKLQNCKTLKDNSNEDNNSKDNFYEKIEYKINNIKDNNYDEEKSKINSNIKNNYYSTDNISSGNINKPKTLGEKMDKLEEDDRFAILIPSYTYY